MEQATCDRAGLKHVVVCLLKLLTAWPEKLTILCVEYPIGESGLQGSWSHLMNKPKAHPSQKCLLTENRFSQTTIPRITFEPPGIWKDDCLESVFFASQRKRSARKSEMFRSLHSASFPETKPYNAFCRDACSLYKDAIWREIMLRLFFGATAPLLQAASFVSCGTQCPLRIGGASNTAGMEQATCDRAGLACCCLPFDCMTRRARIPVRRISYRGLWPARQLKSSHDKPKAHPSQKRLLTENRLSQTTILRIAFEWRQAKSTDAASFQPNAKQSQNYRTCRMLHWVSELCFWQGPINDKRWWYLESVGFPWQEGFLESWKSLFCVRKERQVSRW